MIDVQVIVVVMTLATLVMIPASSFGTNRVPWFPYLSLTFAFQGALLFPLAMGTAVPFKVGVMESLFGLLWLVMVVYLRQRIAFWSAVALTACSTLNLLCGIALMWV